MDGVETFSLADIPRLQGDQVSIPARELAEAFTRTPATTPGGALLQGLLEGWDGAMPPDSPRALAWDAVCQALFERTVLEYYAPVEGMPEFTVPEQRRALYQQVLDDSPLMLGRYSSWDAAIDDGLRTAAERLEAQFGEAPAAWRWDSVHVAAWHHNLGRDSAHAGLNAGDVPVGGHVDSVFNTSVQSGASATHGVSYRQLIDLADVNGMQICIPPGNSGQPGSPHYADNLERWVNVEYHPLFVDWDDIAANAEATLQLTPA
jgi:penicillin amidase